MKSKNYLTMAILYIIEYIIIGTFVKITEGTFFNLRVMESALVTTAFYPIEVWLDAREYDSTPIMPILGAISGCYLVLINPSWIAMLIFILCIIISLVTIWTQKDKEKMRKDENKE